MLDPESIREMRRSFQEEAEDFIIATYYSTVEFFSSLTPALELGVRTQRRIWYDTAPRAERFKGRAQGPKSGSADG